jgi:RNA polymerase sigma factor (sigma-70 family)
MGAVRFESKSAEGARYIAEIARHDFLPEDEVVVLTKRYQRTNDEEALRTLLSTHQRLVLKIASRFRSSGLEIGDLVGYGNLGLVDAVRKFDRKKHPPFHAYAAGRIWSSMGRGGQQFLRQVRRDSSHKVVKEIPSYALHTAINIESLIANQGNEGTRDKSYLLQVTDEETVDFPKMRAILDEPEAWGLTEDETLAFRLHFLEDLNLTDTGERMNVTRQWATQLVTRGLKKIRASLGGTVSSY